MTLTRLAVRGAAVAFGVVAGLAPTYTHPDTSNGDSLRMQISALFTDSRTQILLGLLEHSPTGRHFLMFLLQAGRLLGGDQYIRWTHGLHYAAETEADGTIMFDVDKLMGEGKEYHTDNGGLEHLILSEQVGLAGLLIHEAVESFFVLAHGIVFPALQHEDYVAQWFGGKYLDEMNGQDWGAGLVIVNPGTTAYRKTFTEWINSEDGSGYRLQLESNILMLEYIGLGRLIPHAGKGANWSNGMGISLNMLLANCVGPGQCGS